MAAIQVFIISADCNQLKPYTYTIQKSMNKIINVYIKCVCNKRSYAIRLHDCCFWSKPVKCPSAKPTVKFLIRVHPGPINWSKFLNSFDYMV